MATRTFKIGEYAKGGVITAEVKGTKIAIIGKDWDFSTAKPNRGSTRGNSQKNAKEWTRVEVDGATTEAFSQLYDFLYDLTSSYYTNKIIKWVESKLPKKKKAPWDWE